MYEVRVTVGDGFGGSATDSLLVTVENVAPTITKVTNSGPAAPGEEVTVTVTAADVAGDALTFEFDFDNDGNYEVQAVGTRSGNSTTASARGTFGSSNIYPVNVRVRDDGGMSATSFTAVEVGGGTTAKPPVSFVTSAQFVSEDVREVAVRAVLAEALPDSNALVPLTVTGTATDGSDFSLSQRYLLFAPGTVEAEIRVLIEDDQSDEHLEKLTIRMGTPVNASLGSVTSHAIAIEDNDAPPLVSFGTARQTAYEGGGAISVSARLSEISGKDVSIPISRSGTAEVADYGSFGTELVIPAGQFLGTMQIPIVDDTLREPNETLILEMGDPVNAVLSDAPGAATVHTVVIPENDAPSVSFTSVFRQVSEDVGTVTVSAALSAAPPRRGRDDCSLDGHAERCPPWRADDIQNHDQS